MFLIVISPRNVFLPFWVSMGPFSDLLRLENLQNIIKNIICVKIWAHVRVLEVMSAGNCTGTQSGSNETTPEVQNTVFFLKQYQKYGRIGETSF